MLNLVELVGQVTWNQGLLPRLLSLEEILRAEQENAGKWRNHLSLTNSYGSGPTVPDLLSANVVDIS